MLHNLSTQVKDNGGVSKKKFVGAIIVHSQLEYFHSKCTEVWLTDDTLPMLRVSATNNQE